MNTKTKWTAGEWYTEQGMVVTDEMLIAQCIDRHGSTISKEACANARLIASAPSLLEACEEFIRECDKKASWDKVGGSYLKAKQAIAKAKGE